MPKNPFANNEETSFEQGQSVVKPVKAVSAAAAQQAKAVTQDIVAQLYGVSDKSKNDPNDPKSQQPPPKPQKTVHKLSGTSNVGDHAKFIARQHYLDKGDSEGAEKAMFHMQHYFDENVMTLEDRVKRYRQEQERDRQQRKQQEEQEQSQKKQQEAKEKEELPQATGKGRNRMGKKPKTSIALKMSQTKTEVNRGATG